jgi:RNA polymerase sigma-70 factor (ECF subfamily)
MNTTLEQDLLRRLLKGDEEAFTALYRIRHGAICRFALHMTGRMDLAEDVTQETFLAVALHGRRYDASRGSVVAFLYGIARNLVLKRLEKEHPADASIPLDEFAGDEDVLEDLTRRESIDEVRRAVLSLPQVYREAVVLCDLGDASYEDAALTLGCPVGTVRSRLNRARSMLAKKLAPRCLVL